MEHFSISHRFWSHEDPLTNSFSKIGMAMRTTIAVCVVVITVFTVVNLIYGKERSNHALPGGTTSEVCSRTIQEHAAITAFNSSITTRILPFTDDELAADLLHFTSTGSFWSPRPPVHPITGYERRSSGGGFIGQKSISIVMFRDYNAGDFLSLFIAPIISGRIVQSTELQEDKPALAVVGSILQRSPRYSWGAGFISAASQYIRMPSIDQRIFAFRGPVSHRQYLDQFPDLVNVTTDVYGDAGLLTSWFYQPHDTTPRHNVCLIPHYVDHKPKYIDPIQSAFDGLRVISIRAPFLEIMDAIVQCRFVLSSSLHGLIFADSYRIPNAHIQLSQEVVGGTHKFDDYHQAVRRTRRTYRWTSDSSSPLLQGTDLPTFVARAAAAYVGPQLNMVPYWNACPMHAAHSNKTTRDEHLAFARQYVKRFVDVQNARYPQFKDFEKLIVWGLN